MIGVSSNANGKVVWQSEGMLEENYLEVDTNNFSNGMYYVHLQSEEQTFTKSFIISK
ncbi:MAG: T9SS type A sorting domain-containing protein [Bacteroidota bacterium]